MSLNIKNERVHALAREAARRTGQNQTKVIEQALTRLLATLPDEDAAADRDRDALITSIQDSFASGNRGIEIDDLYDENGLPA